MNDKIKESEGELNLKYEQLKDLQNQYNETINQFKKLEVGNFRTGRNLHEGNSVRSFYQASGAQIILDDLKRMLRLKSTEELPQTRQRF